MPSIAATTAWEAERAELQNLLQSPLFARSPALSRLLSYLCEKTFAGEADQIKEYSVALEVFDRRDSFDQDTDSIVRVEANRLRKRLSEYYGGEGAWHSIHISIPVGQYVPVFDAPTVSNADALLSVPTPWARARAVNVPKAFYRSRVVWWAAGVVAMLAVLAIVTFVISRKHSTQINPSYSQPSSSEPSSQASVEPAVGLPIGDEIRILAGSSRKYVDHAGKLWSPDQYFSGGQPVSAAVQHIWRTQDPIIYRNSRQGEFAYNIPLKPGTHELHLHFAEVFYGPENAGGGEGSRLMTIHANGRLLLQDFDVLADSGGDRTAEVKVFPDISPASDGQLHLSFSSAHAGSAMVSAIEILPGIRGRLRPVRILARDVPYYSNDSRWWSPDAYFKGGQMSSAQEPALGTDDPEFYETERWGHFSYAIPVSPGGYSVTLYFIEHHLNAQDASGSDRLASDSDKQPKKRLFNVFCNGKTVLANLNINEEVGLNHPWVRTIKGVSPNAQGKLLLEFVPVTGYSTVTALEVVSE